MELLMEDKEKVMGDYLCNLKFTVSKTWLEMLCHVVFIFTFHCVTKKISTHCVMSGDLSDEVSWFFLLCFVLSYLCQTAKSSLSPIYCQRNMHQQKCFQKTSDSEYRIFKAKDKLLTHCGNYFLRQQQNSLQLLYVEELSRKAFINFKNSGLIQEILIRHQFKKTQPGRFIVTRIDKSLKPPNSFSFQKKEKQRKENILRISCDLLKIQ